MAADDRGERVALASPLCGVLTRQPPGFAGWALPGWCAWTPGIISDRGGRIANWAGGRPRFWDPVENAKAVVAAASLASTVPVASPPASFRHWSRWRY